jgi:hypothetical protein
MDGRTDKAAPAVAIVITAFEPVAVLGEELQHPIENPQAFPGRVLGHLRPLIGNPSILSPVAAQWANRIFMNSISRVLNVISEKES